MTQAWELLDEFADAALAFGQVARERITALHHEVRDDAVELHAVVEAGIGELLEVLDGLRGVLLVELRGDRAAVGLECGGLGQARAPGWWMDPR